MTRQANGQFGKGNPGGPGRPRRQTELDYLRTAAGTVGLDRWQRIVEKAAQDAEAGDWRARQFLAGYLMPERPKASGSSFKGSLMLQRDDDRGIEADLTDLSVRVIAGRLPI